LTYGYRLFIAISNLKRIKNEGRTKECYELGEGRSKVEYRIKGLKIKNQRLKIRQQAVGNRQEELEYGITCLQLAGGLI
jgi:hypothetical protein